MSDPDLTLPVDLLQYIKMENAKIEGKREREEEKADQMGIKLVHPGFSSIVEKRLTMNPFVELFKRVIKSSLPKQNTQAKAEPKAEAAANTDTEEDDEVSRINDMKPYSIQTRGVVDALATT